MKNSPPSLSDQLAKIERDHRRLVIADRFLIGLLFVVTLGLGADFVHGFSTVQPPIPPVRPPVAKLRVPLAVVSMPDLPPALFHLEKPPESAQSQVPQVVPEAEWKVNGISFGTVKRAFLQDAEGKKSVWVTEGEQLGAYRVKEIRERSVILEANGKSYEIRM